MLWLIPFLHARRLASSTCLSSLVYFHFEIWRISWENSGNDVTRYHAWSLLPSLWYMRAQTWNYFVHFNQFFQLQVNRPIGVNGMYGYSNEWTLIFVLLRITIAYLSNTKQYNTVFRLYLMVFYHVSIILGHRVIGLILYNSLSLFIVWMFWVTQT